jgi:membrane protease subunit HflK
MAFSLTGLWRSLRGDRAQLTYSNGDRRPNRDGPPDLEELWQNFNRRLNSLLRRSGGGGGGAPIGGRPSLGAVVAIAAGAIFFIWIASGFYQVPEGYSGVVLRFGRYEATTGPGQSWHLPYPIESVEKVDQQHVHDVVIGGNSVNRETSLKDSSMLTGDELIIDVRFAVQYRVRDAAEYLFNNADPEANVTQASETAVREIVGRNTMDFVLYSGKATIAAELPEDIQKILDRYKTGIIVTSVSVQSVQAPEQVQAAFDDVVKATQDRERAKNEGQAYANDVIPRARGDASRLLQEADGYKARVVDRAQGDAARFKKVYTEYSKAPEVTRERLYLEAMQDVFSHTTKVLVDPHGSSSLLYLPLDKLIEQSRAASAAAAVTAPASSPQAGATSVTPAFPATNDESRTRDPAKSRERDVR